MSGRKVPQWVADYINEWKERLYLHEWETRTKITPHPAEDGSGSTRAAVQVYPNILVADIELRDDIPDDPADKVTVAGWEQTIIHELLHVRLGRLGSMVQDHLIPELAPTAREFAQKTFERELEPVIELMSQVLHRLAVANPEGAEDEQKETVRPAAATPAATPTSPK